MASMEVIQILIAFALYMEFKLFETDMKMPSQGRGICQEVFRI